jgi:hypothetical protein
MLAQIPARAWILGLLSTNTNIDFPSTSIELNSATPVAEWDNQKVYIMEEDDAYLTDDGFKTFLPRQTSFYLILP